MAVVKNVGGKLGGMFGGRVCGVLPLKKHPIVSHDFHDVFHNVFHTVFHNVSQSLFRFVFSVQFSTLRCSTPFFTSVVHPYVFHLVIHLSFPPRCFSPSDELGS